MGPCAKLLNSETRPLTAPFVKYPLCRYVTGTLHDTANFNTVVSQTTGLGLQRVIQYLFIMQNSGLSPRTAESK